MGETIRLPWGNDELAINLPDQWHIKGFYEPAALPAVKDPAAEITRALTEPIGSLPLRQLVKPGMRITIVMDDASRPTPVSLIFPQVLQELKHAGIQEQDLIIVPAIGLHRGMPEEEVRQRLGVGSDFPLHFSNPDCDNPETMVNLGTTSRGTPVWINHQVAEADFVISIGCIEPHIIASFGGGYKNIIPGVAGRATTAHNHTLNCATDTFNMVGQPIDLNPMRQDLEEGSRMLNPPVFIVNAILNNIQQVVQIVSGDPIQAHRKGVETSANLYGIQIDQMADIVISTSHPMNQDLRQGVKALANTIRALKPGGVHITLIQAEEGVGVFGLANSSLTMKPALMRFLAPLLIPLVPKLKIKGLGEEDRFFLYFALQGMMRGKLFLYAPTIPEEIHSHLPFVTFWPSVGDALAAARKVFPGQADVLVFPGGGITYPYLK